MDQEQDFPNQGATMPGYQRLTPEDNKNINLLAAELAQNTPSEVMQDMIENMDPELRAEFAKRDMHPLLTYFRKLAEKDFFRRKQMDEVVVGAINAEQVHTNAPNNRELSKLNKRKATVPCIESGKSTNHPPSSFNAYSFSTPENRDFYDKSPYSPLDPMTQEIRLLELLPVQENGVLEVNMISGCFLEPELLEHDYCAISYCAGDPNKVELIKVNGFNFNAFASLGFALRQVLDARSRGELGDCPHLIWADQICINQSDPIEKSRQVMLMRNIFQTATEVLVPLGEDHHNGLWLEMMFQLCLVIKVEGDSLFPRNIPPVEFKETEVWIGDRFLDDFQNPSFQAKWRALKEVADLPWWKRGWICQEVIVSQKATLLIGPGVANFEHFAKAAQVATSILRASIRAVFNDPDLLEDPATSVIISGVRGFDATGAVSLSANRAEWNTKGDLELKDLLELSRRCKVSDPRDGVFAFIGMADPRYGIVPDYTADIQTVFRQTCKRIILYERSLSILCHSQEPDRQLLIPSWTPDWSSDTSWRSLSETRYGFRSSSDYSSAAAFDSLESDKPDSILRVQCLLIDRVADENGMGYNPRLEQPETSTETTLGPILEDWARVAGGTEMLEFVRGMNPRESGEKIENIDELPMKPKSTYFNGELLWDAFISSIHRGLQEDDLPGNLSGEKDGQEERLLEMRISVGGDWVFFRSPRGYIGLADSRALPTDSICVLFGAPVPFILRRQGNGYVLIGEAYVHGFMYGEAIEMMQSGSLEVKTIDIV